MARIAVEAGRWDFCADSITLNAKADETCLVVITYGQSGRGKWSVTKPTLTFIFVTLVNLRTKEEWISSGQHLAITKSQIPNILVCK